MLLFMSNNIIKLDILNTIKGLESKKFSRKVNIKDITNYEKKQLYTTQKNNEKIKGYREQEEYGEKKFIKPWRTSTKSQQQPPRSGKKAGGRGQQRG